MNPQILAEIPVQRAERWPNFHPEVYCHRCGEPNITWFAPSTVWNALMRADGDSKPEPFNGIICPVCFAQMWELAFDDRPIFQLRLDWHNGEPVDEKDAEIALLERRLADWMTPA